MVKFLSEHKFKAHLVSFALMVLASIGLYLAINNGASGLIWILLAGYILANILAIVVK